MVLVYDVNKVLNLWGIWFYTLILLILVIVSSNCAFC